MAREAPSRVDLYFEDFLVGMDDLEPEERGDYFTICCLIWKGKGRLKDDDRYLARQTNSSSVRAFRRVKASLIAKGKIEVVDGMVRQTRAESEFKLAVARYESAKERGGKGAEIRHGKPAKPLRENGGGSSPASSPASGPASSPALSRGSSYQQPPPTESESLAGKPESGHPRAGAREEPASQPDPVLIDRLEETVEARGQTVVDLRGSVAGWHKALGGDGWLAAKLIELLHRDDVPKPFNWLASAVDGELQRRAGLARPPDPPSPPKPPDGFLGRAQALGLTPRLADLGVQAWERIAAESDAGRLDDEGVRAALAWCERHQGRPWRPRAPGQGSGAA